MPDRTSLTDDWLRETWYALEDLAKQDRISVADRGTLYDARKIIIKFQVDVAWDQRKAKAEAEQMHREDVALEAADITDAIRRGRCG
jgi:Spy/CpxP family protein refolding chaperone